MANTKSYAGLPVNVATAMADFAGNSCVKVKKITVAGYKALNCHLNVTKHVELNGGKVVNGWLLSRNAKFFEQGVWHFSFHSIWEDEKGDWFDVTPDRNNQREFSAFVPDVERTVDLVAGISFNDCVYFTRDSVVPYVKAVPAEKLVWTYSGFQCYEPIERDGSYKWLFPEYPDNYVQLKQDYGVEIVNGVWVGGNGCGEVPVTISFDYSFSMA